MRALLDQQNSGPRRARRTRRSKARDTTADHQNVGEGVEMFVGVGVAVNGGRAEAGGFADDGFEDVLPECTGEHEGLVIEPGR